MDCPACGHADPGGAKFCQQCGGRFTAACASCGVELPADARFCHECGTTQEQASAADPERDRRAYTPKHLAEKILQSKSALEGERKQVTVLFADAKGRPAAGKVP
jgi:ribosomal protein L40E